MAPTPSLPTIRHALAHSLCNSTSPTHTPDVSEVAARSCAPEAAEPSTFDDAFGAAIRQRVSPWNASRMHMHTIYSDFLHAAEWCRVQLCTVKGRIFVRGWRQSAARPDVAVPEFLAGGRHHAATLGFAAALQQHRDVVNVCVTVNCQDRPAVPRHRSASQAAWPDRQAPLILSYVSSDDHMDV